MLGWMTYAALVGALVGAAAWLLDRSLTAIALPTRWVWLLAIAVSVMAPAITALRLVDFGETGRAGAAVGRVSVLERSTPSVRAERSDLSPTGWVAVFSEVEGVLTEVAEGRDRLLTTGTAALANRIPLGSDLSRWFLLFWGIACIGLGTFFVWGLVRLRRRSLAWPEAEVQKRNVRISPDFGPAAMGLLKPEIVLPKWSLELPASALGLVLVHEEEHVRARDPLALACGAAAVVAMPWNVALWWQIRGLRDAVEVDCDRRVLRRRPDAAPYARILVKLGTRARTDVVLTPALSGSRSLLERRLEVMRKRPTRMALARALGASLVGVALAVTACTTTPPEVPEAAAPDSAQDDVTGLAARPQPTPVPARELAQAVADSPRDSGAGAVQAAPGQRPVLPALDFGPALGARALVRRVAAPGEPLQVIVFSGLGANAMPDIDPFTAPQDVAPQLRNAAEVHAAIAQAYPADLRSSGVGGTSLVRLFVGESGEVEAAIVQEGSGTWALDAAAREAAMLFEFTPATSDGRPVGAWVSLPLTFRP
jgi:TonB family protein